MPAPAPAPAPSPPPEPDALRVVVRVRPLNGREADAGSCVHVPEARTIMVSDQAKPEMAFVRTFDAVLGPGATQADLFRAVGVEAVDHAMSGYNSTLFAYGQTGAGKTHSLTGQVSQAGHPDAGLAPRIFDELFRRMHAGQGGSGNFESPDADVEEGCDADRAPPASVPVAHLREAPSNVALPRAFGAVPASPASSVGDLDSPPVQPSRTRSLIPSPPASRREGAAPPAIPACLPASPLSSWRSHDPSAPRLASPTSATTTTYSARCSFLEIYNEEVIDLLAPGAPLPLQLRDGDPSRGVFAKDLSEHSVSSAGDVLALLIRGGERRRVGATAMNERSSRSHAVFTCTVTATVREKWTGGRGWEGEGNGCRPGGGEDAARGDERGEVEGAAIATPPTRVLVRTSKLNMVDLAGSERASRSGATGGQLVEARSINLSLAVLGRVMAALVDRQRNPKVHVPYRDSRLTFLLQESLGGNSRTAMVACVTPASDAAAETASTLAFAASAKRVQTRAAVNEDREPADAASSAANAALRAENARLRRRLARVLGAPASGDQGGGGGGGFSFAAAAASVAPVAASCAASSACSSLRSSLDGSAGFPPGTPAAAAAAATPLPLQLSGSLEALEAESRRASNLETMLDQNNALLADLRAERERLRADLACSARAAERSHFEAQVAQGEAEALAAALAAADERAEEAEAVARAAQEAGSRLAEEVEALRERLAAVAVGGAAGGAGPVRDTDPAPSWGARAAALRSELEAEWSGAGDGRDAPAGGAAAPDAEPAPFGARLEGAVRAHPLYLEAQRMLGDASRDLAEALEIGEAARAELERERAERAGQAASLTALGVEAARLREAALDLERSLDRSEARRRRAEAENEGLACTVERTRQHACQLSEQLAEQLAASSRSTRLLNDIGRVVDAEAEAVLARAQHRALASARAKAAGGGGCPGAAAGEGEPGAAPARDPSPALAASPGALAASPLPAAPGALDDFGDLYSLSEAFLTQAPEGASLRSTFGPIALQAPSLLALKVARSPVALSCPPHKLPPSRLGAPTPEAVPAASPERAGSGDIPSLLP